MPIGYRLFVRGTNNQPRTLYHAHRDGSKELKTGVWLEAVQRIGANPGKLHENSKKFRTGWHIFPTLDDLKKYCAKMNPAYVVSEVFYRGKVRRKPRSRSSVLLATEMYIPLESWWFRSDSLGNVLGWRK